MSPAASAGARGRDFDRGRLQVGRGVEVLDLAGGPFGLFAGRVVAQRIGDRDREVVRERLGALAGAQLAAHGHGLAGLERLGGHEARAVALGVGPQMPRVGARPRAADRDVRELGGGSSEQADLGVRRCVQRVRQRRYGDARPGQDVAAVHRGWNAGRGCRAGEGRLLGDDPAAAERQGAGAREQDDGPPQHERATQPAVVGVVARPSGAPAGASVAPAGPPDAPDGRP